MSVVQNNLVSIIILLILFLGIFKQVNRQNPIYKVFIISLITNAFMLMLESILFLISGLSGSLVAVVLASIAILYHGIIPIFLFLMFMFYEFHFHSKVYKASRYLIPFSILFLINFVFSILSITNGYLFDITQNVYTTGSYYIQYELVIYFVSALIFVYALIQRQKHNQLSLMQLIMFIIPVTASMIFTVLSYITYTTFNAFTISLLIIYIGIQMQLTSTDYLTGLKNRRGYEYLLYHLNKIKITEEVIIGIVLDIDNFKLINDYFGHQKGDEGLRALGAMLKKAVRKNDFVSRTGGDEFAIIIRACDASVNQIIIDRIYQELDEFNKEKALGFQLHVSIGSGIYDSEKYHSLTDFFKHLDEAMYRDKRKKNKVVLTKDITG